MPIIVTVVVVTTTQGHTAQLSHKSYDLSLLRAVRVCVSEFLSEWAPTAMISFSAEENDTELDTPKDIDSFAGT